MGMNLLRAKTEESIGSLQRLRKANYARVTKKDLDLTIDLLLSLYEDLVDLREDHNQLNASLEEDE